MLFDDGKQEILLLDKGVCDCLTPLVGKTIRLGVEEFTSCLKLLEDDRVVAKAKDSGVPCILVRGDTLLANFDESRASRVTLTDSKRPLYTYLPGFNIRIIPSTVARPISNLLESRKTKSVDESSAIEYYANPRLNDNDVLTFLLDAINRCHRGKQGPLFTWPKGKRAAFVPVHDVDSSNLMRLRSRDPLLQLENKYEVKATWFLLTKFIERLQAEDLDFLISDGHEIGWHGYNHDHRLAFSKHSLKRIELLNLSILSNTDFHPMGMRTPKLLKTLHLFESVAEYNQFISFDMSFTHGVFPYPLVKSATRTIYEIPTTIPTDLVLYRELGSVPLKRRFDLMFEIQKLRATRLIEMNGIIAIDTHPEPDVTEQPQFLRLYERFLKWITQRSDIWFATTGELYDYWRSKEAARRDADLALVESSIPSASGPS